jgi:uncharacterized membrane protein (DUF485 family)
MKHLRELAAVLLFDLVMIFVVAVLVYNLSDTPPREAVSWGIAVNIVFTVLAWIAGGIYRKRKQLKADKARIIK